MGVREMATWACTTYDAADADATDASDANATVAQNAAIAVARNDIAQAALRQVNDLLPSAAEGLVVIHRRYHYTASEGQVTFGGLDDDNVYMYIQPQNVRVFVNGALRSDIRNLDINWVDLDTAVSAGDSVVIVSKFLYALAEDGSLIEYPMSDDLTISNGQYLASIPSGSEVLVNSTPAFTPSATGSAKLYWDGQAWAYYIDPNTGSVVEIDQSAGIPNPDTYLIGNYHTVNFDFMHLFTTQRRLTSEEISNIESDYNILWEVLFNGGELSEGGFSLSDIHFYYPATEGTRAQDDAIQNFMWQAEEQKIVLYSGPGQGNKYLYIIAENQVSYYINGLEKIGTGAETSFPHKPNDRLEIYDPSNAILSIRDSRMYGYSPDFSNSPNLERVDIQGFVNDGMIGEMPFFRNCPSLGYIELYRNHFTGNVTADRFEGSANIEHLGLSFNSFVGEIATLDFLPNAEYIHLGYNYGFTGDFPSTQNLLLLKELHIDRCYFQNIGALAPNLEYFYSYSGHNIGVLPQLPSSIIYVDVNANSFESFGNLENLPNLTYFDGSSNHVNSAIPTFGASGLLETVYLDSNWFTGDMPSSFPGLTSLKILNLSNNGSLNSSPSNTMPDFQYNMLLEQINLSSCNLHGPMTDISMLSALTRIYLRNPNMTGDLFDFINHPNLYFVDLYNNTGMTPTAFPDLSISTVLNTLWLRSIPFAGLTIPQLNTAINLANLDIQSCGLGGDFPDSDSTKLQTIYGDGNQFTNTTLPSFYSLVRVVFLKDNSMSGDPSGWGAYYNLQTLNISGNDYTGALPAFTNQPSLTTFDASNQISANAGDGIGGGIPNISGAPNLKYYYVHGNNLTLDIPDLSVNTKLVSFHAYNNFLSSYTGSGFPAKLTSLQLQNNALDETSIDNILVQMLSSVVNTPRSGTLNLSGGTNSTPSGVGSGAAVALQGYGWTVTTN